MMDDMKIVGTLDVTELVFYAFVLFFLALIFYLRREDRREGYPLEDEVTGRVDTWGGPLQSATAKTFILPFGQGSASTPTQGREPVDVAGKRTFRSPGAPYQPTGNPLVDGMGPAAWADRSKKPDLNCNGLNRIVPIGAASHAVSVHHKDVDPRGLRVIAADGAVAGTISDLWIDTSDDCVRYLEVDTGTVKVLAPMAMSLVKRGKGVVEIDAINAADFAGVPRPAVAGQISRYEEERVLAYYGGGYLYANSARQEPLI
jgi:photosynthetic reaction center H subunit